MSQRLRIQNYLVTLAKASAFYAVTYDASTGLAAELDTSPANKVPPVTCVSNETHCQFAGDSNMGRRLVQKRGTWTFDLDLAFDKEVACEFFEQAVLDEIPVLPRVGEYSPIVLRLAGAKYDHPPQQSPATGTKATFTFEAEVGRA